MAKAQAIVIRPAGSAWSNIAEHLRRLSEYRDLLLTLSIHRINVRYRQTVVGIAWAILQPLVLMVVFALVFSRLGQMSSEGMPYALFAYAALLPWTFFSTAVMTATGSLVNHTQLITKVYFPREILPLTYVVVALFDFALGLIALAALMAWFDVAITSAVLLILPLVGLMAAWALAVSLITSAVQVRWRDIGVAMPVIVQIGLFVSPVIYPLSAVPDAWRALYLLNPMAGIIQSFRDVLLRGSRPEATPLVFAIAVTAVVLPLAYLFFKRAEATMADVV